LPADLAATCPDPGVKAGQDARAALARNRSAFKACRARHKDAVDFYTKVRRLRPKVKP
jgi:hypothetical protein